MKVLELFSGLGGMHLALKESGIEGEIISSVDINTVANTVYKSNFPKTSLLNRNIQSLTPKFINNLGVNTILMSPPCQPFTRNGLKGDVNDVRTCSFTHILEILGELNIDNILIENVKGFETSHMHKKFIETLEKCDYIFQEFILSPTQVGVPNTRNRYYCIAKKRPGTFNFEVTSLRLDFPEPFDKQCFVISSILENDLNTGDYLLPDKILQKRVKILDFVYPTSSRSCCFTKAYGKYMEGTGSVLCDKNEHIVEAAFAELETYAQDSEHFLNRVKELNLRFFTPKEVSRLMSFPDSYHFPDEITRKQRYNLLGNSINVKVVAELIKLLNNTK